MPELPEVETTVRGLRTKVLSRTFIDVWTDTKKIIKKPKDFEEFRKQLKGKKIQKIWRRGKNIIFGLSKDYSLLIHQKLTGHLLVGYWILDNGYWKPKEKGLLEEKINTYIHLLFTLDNRKMLALSDLRKFAKVELWRTEDLKNSKELKSLGPEPLEKSFTFEKFKEVLENKKGKVKQVLMNQEIIAGVGNIYSDETLWAAKVHPFRDVSKLKEEELKRIYQALKKILKKAIKLRGESISDYRDPAGRKGKFDKIRKVYRREGERCSRCGTIIQRKKIGSRSCHFCPKCQKL
ncbi:DNA-formamidopyrimidine glycosylase [Patescibacteria group bacterium]|nr:DNA-formamidopyrimidine glycosylase [Patescibacteria group bacterium]